MFDGVLSSQPITLQYILFPAGRLDQVLGSTVKDGVESTGLANLFCLKFGVVEISSWNRLLHPASHVKVGGPLSNEPSTGSSK